MQREERETEQVLKSVQARTGLTFPKAGPQAAGGEDAKGTSFYSQSEGGHGAATSKGVASKPIHLLSMQTGAGVKKASRSNGASGNPGAAVLGAMVPRAVAKQQQQQYQPKAAIPINVEAIGRETSDPAGTVQETTIGSGLMNREGSERMTTTNGGEDVLDLVADKEGRSLQKESLSLSSPAGDTKDDDREDECKHRNRDHGGGDGEKEIVLRRFDKPKHLRQ